MAKRPGGRKLDGQSAGYTLTPEGAKHGKWIYKEDEGEWRWHWNVAEIEAMFAKMTPEELQRLKDQAAPEEP